MWSMTWLRMFREYESNVDGRTVGSIAPSHSVRNSPSVWCDGSTYSPRSNFESRSIRARSASRLVRVAGVPLLAAPPGGRVGIELDLDVVASSLLDDRTADRYALRRS